MEVKTVRSHHTLKLTIWALLFFTIALVVACSQKPKSHNIAQASLIPSELNDANKSPHEIAHFVYANYKCAGCHTLSNEGKFGYTSRGAQLKQESEGCVSLLTSMSVIAHIPESDRKPEQSLKAAHFKEYGCAVCHEVKPGYLGLTQTGEKLSSLHMSCSEVQQILNRKEEEKMQRRATD